MVKIIFKKIGWAILRTKLELKYDHVGHRHEGMIRVINKGKQFHLREDDGKPAYAEKFRRVGIFSEGLAKATFDKKEWFFINKEGQKAFPQTFQDAHGFKDGQAIVKKDGSFIYIDKKGNEKKKG